MNLVLNTHNLTLKEMDENHINRRMAFAFSHYHGAIETLEIDLSKVDNTKGNTDTECKLVAHIPGQKDVIIIEQQAQLKQAVDRAMFRASYVLKQRFKRNSQRFYRKAWKIGGNDMQKEETHINKSYESKG
ncbi:MAG: hypothetical protein MI867_24730 [Pseudomonadales bacterium]|nr:hypothetical protein [Pseudomonadales bacterium]